MKQRTSQIIYAYWNEVRGERVAPRRFDIEPARIAHILPETFILERVDAATLRFRLAGTRICEQFGFEFRGTNLLDIWSTEDRPILERLFDDLAARGGVGLLSLVATSAEGRAATFEAVALPLHHASDVADRFLGSLSAVAPQSWLGLERLTTARLTSHEIIWPDGRPHALVQRFHNQTPFHPVMTSARIVRSERRQFRVFDGGLGRDDADGHGG